MADEPLAHIARPNPPWRDDHLTECGHAIADVAKTIPCEEAVAFAKQHGKQRASLFLCQTCCSTASRHSHGGWDMPAVAQSWDRDPVAVLMRYLEKTRYRMSGRGKGETFDVVTAELRAIGILVDEHRAEFDALVEGLRSAADLGDRRARKRYLRDTAGQ